MSTSRVSGGRNAVSVPFNQLAELANRKRPSAVKKWCQNLGISYSLDADGRPWTTSEKLNAAIERGRKTEPDFGSVRAATQSPQKRA